MDQKEIGKIIKQKRKEKKLTQEQLANKLYVTSKTISRWETGNYMPDISTLPLISKELNIDLNELLGADIKTQKAIKNNKYYLKDFFKRKSVRYSLIAFSIIPLIIVITAFIDYQLMKKNYLPMFARIKTNVSFVNIMNEKTNYKEEIINTYIGFGYNIETCPNCIVKKRFHFLNMGDRIQDEINCQKGDNQIANFFFNNGILKNITINHDLKKRNEQNFNTKIINELNQISGCKAVVQEIKGVESQYLSCNLDAMSEADIITVFHKDKKTLQKTKKEIYTEYSKSMNCEKDLRTNIK